jgi:hypothetical protein
MTAAIENYRSANQKPRNGEHPHENLPGQAHTCTDRNSEIFSC